MVQKESSESRGVPVGVSTTGNDNTDDEVDNARAED